VTDTPLSLDTPSGTTEAMCVYAEAHAANTQTIMVSRAAFDVLDRLVDGTNGAELLGSLVAQTGEPWSERRFPDPGKTVQAALQDALNSAVVRHLASLEAFFHHSVKDLVQFDESTRQLPTFEHAHDSLSEMNGGRCGRCSNAARDFCNQASEGIEDRISALGKLLHFDDSDSEPLLLILRYFRLARNRIIHGGGLANAELASLSMSDELKAALTSWYAQCRRPGPTLPEFYSGDPVAFDAPQAVLLIAIAYKLAKSVTAMIASTMSARSYLEMALYYSLCADDHPHRESTHTDAEKPVANFLHRYRVSPPRSNDLIAPMKNLGLWPLTRAKFTALYDEP